jgi:hypothetical protein
VSEPENFLSRWARRKREAAEAAAPPDAAVPEAAATETGADAPAGAGTTPPAAEPPFDLSTLPPIESITATTDIRAFLAPGVPPELTRAALRRAWVADPAIRDFIGIAENQWDFNDPNGIPGFGSLGPLDDVRRLVAQVIGASDREAEAPAVVAEKRSAVAGPDSEYVAGDRRESASTEGDLPAPEPAPEQSAPVGPDTAVAAAQKPTDEEPAQPAADVPARRTHGGALPK